MRRFLRPVTLLLALLLLLGLAAGCGPFGAYQFKGTRLEPPIPVPDFELQRTDGQPFHLDELKGDIALIYFGYTFCPDVCPLTLADVRTALNGLETGRERVHVLFISVDPERDTPEALAKYMAAFGPEYIGLRGDFAEVQAVMKPYGAYAEKEVTSDSAAGYLVSHTARLYLVGPQREMLLQYPYGFEADDLRSDLAYLLQQEKL